MKITREQAIRILDTNTIEGDWVEGCERVGCYDKQTDDWPKFSDVMEALGVSQEEYLKAILKREGE